LKTATPTPDFFDDAQNCNQQARVTDKLRINLGVLGSKYGNANVGGGSMDIPIQLGTDQQSYRVCMEGLGWKAEPGKDPYFALTETCRKSTATPASAKAEGAGEVKISGGFDAIAYDECMRNKGVTGSVIVLPIKPDAPPN
jgi:hypothetical protein